MGQIQHSVLQFVPIIINQNYVGIQIWKEKKIIEAIQKIQQMLSRKLFFSYKKIAWYTITKENLRGDTKH